MMSARLSVSSGNACANGSICVWIGLPRPPHTPPPAGHNCNWRFKESLDVAFSLICYIYLYTIPHSNLTGDVPSPVVPDGLEQPKSLPEPVLGKRWRVTLEITKH